MTATPSASVPVSGSGNGTATSAPMSSFANGIPRKSTRLILMVGDSITQYAVSPGKQGFQALLANDYSRLADVINRGMSGWTSSNWIAHLDQLLAEWSPKPPSLVTIFLGTNDAALPHTSKHVPIETYAANLRTMVQRFNTSFGGTKFILLTPPVVGINPSINEMYLNNATKPYAMRCKQVGSDLNVPVIDLWTPLQGVPDIHEDGLHLSATGNAYVHKQLVATIEASYPELAPAKLRPDY
ncbi:hypothetical protein SPRG_14569 [Saprolegnia parasitica CBS 223.65]|uniref:SGNH hydrolase-type esterase domain-containing protein n=1 Tax=Saprolegnia parasitica (strain CBS 223.65) TaxID=695850 RepID=A0A067BN98_SAPPC|nr:hypothetical protein SPRG_14569 [Saprolegnia parasitica CBS 223.65]KDO19989.1 hypothetical protein SPRG_14569 [Saprolegnia parasitica CBS 223.65]|eukprot:XP_012209292.1 hypothetical protein SPRG_14569 [Saprolegnia parasitica CBS 223.65]